MNIYDVNNNCNRCGAYVYDQHAKKCKHYVDETASDVAGALTTNFEVIVESNSECIAVVEEDTAKLRTMPRFYARDVVCSNWTVLSTSMWMVQLTGRNFQLRTARIADWSKSSYPEERPTDTDVGSPEALTDTMRRTTPFLCSTRACCG